MDYALPALRPLAADRSPWLRGRMQVPGDRAISHRALILGAMARGQTTIDGLLENEGVLATARAMQALGARVEKRGRIWHVSGMGVGGFLEPEAALDFASSGTGLGLCMGLLGLYDFASRFRGSAALSSRPLQHLLGPLREIGVNVLEHDGDRLPVALRGPRTPVPIEYRIPTASAEVKSCLLLAGLLTPGTSSVSEPAATADHTERMLEAFGAQVRTATDSAGNHIVEIEGLPDLRGRAIAVPGDPSLAAFGMVAALIVPGSELVLENILINSSRAGLIDTLLEMGADIEVLDARSAAGEQVADLRVRHSELTGVSVPPERAVPMLADFPALAIAAACATGNTTMEGVGALRRGRIDRLAALAKGLRVNAVHCEESEDRLVVEGTGRVKGGGRVVTWGDHRIAMAFLVLGMAADDAVTIDDQSPISTAFPEFVRRFEDIGASFIHYSD